MSDLETRIAEWRARMKAALPLREEAVLELEEHLREHLANLQGRPIDEAFALALERLGRPDAIAREFERTPARWRPATVLLTGLALFLAFALGAILWMWSRRMPLTVLQLVASITTLLGYFAVLGSGLIAVSAFFTTWLRPVSDSERWALRRLLRKLARTAAIALPIGLALGALWQAQLVPDFWTRRAFQLRLIGNLTSLIFFVYAQWRPVSHDRARWLGAIFASIVLVSSGFAKRDLVAGVPVAWLCALFLAGQVFLILPRFRIVRVREMA